MKLIAVFIAKLFDPIAAVLSIIVGLVSRKWWHVAIGAIVVATVVEVILFNIQITRVFDPVTFLIGCAAAGVWSSGAQLVKRAIRRKKSN